MGSWCSADKNIVCFGGETDSTFHRPSPPGPQPSPNMKPTTTCRTHHPRRDEARGSDTCASSLLIASGLSNKHRKHDEGMSDGLTHVADSDGIYDNLATIPGTQFTLTVGRLVVPRDRVNGPMKQQSYTMWVSFRLHSGNWRIQFGVIILLMCTTYDMFCYHI